MKRVEGLDILVDSHEHEQEESSQKLGFRINPENKGKTRPIPKLPMKKIRKIAHNVEELMFDLDTFILY